MHLPLEHKVCFSYDKVEGAIIVPELEGFSGDEMDIINRYYDDLTILNEERKREEIWQKYQLLFLFIMLKSICEKLLIL